MSDLPPELARLGDALTRAAMTVHARRHRRRARARRTALTALAGVLALISLAPAGLAPAVRDVRVATVATAEVSTLLHPYCDQPRGARFSVPRGCVPTRPVIYASPLGGRAAADGVVVG